MGMTSRIPAIIVSQIEELPIYQITILRLHNRNKNKLHAELNELLPVYHVMSSFPLKLSEHD